MNDLFKDFESIDEKQWKASVQVELKGADYAKSLITPMAEGFDIKPLYTKNDVSTESFLAEKNQWKIISKFIPTTQIPYDILDGILLSSDQLNDYQPTETELVFSTFENEFPLVSAFNQNTFFDWDFLSDLVEYGNYVEKSQEQSLSVLNQIIAKKSYQNSLSINIARYQNFGANHVQQLALMLVEAAEYMELTKNEAILSHLLVKTATGSDFFMEIAKLRALRILWENFANAYQSHSQVTILAETTLRNKSVKDKFNNIVRTTYESAAAIFGNADAILVHPYDELFVENKDLALELGFKQQFVLREESFLNHYIDPLKGSYYVEFLTEQLAIKAWELFKKWEKEGGFLSGLKKGSIQNRIKEAAHIEQDKFDKGEISLIGVNKFPNQNDKMLLDEIKPKAKNSGKTMFATLPKTRLAEALEKE